MWGSTYFIIALLLTERSMYNKNRREEAAQFSRPSRTNSPVVSVASECTLHEFIAVVSIQSH